jgi:hypothetical protein
MRDEPGGAGNKKNMDDPEMSSEKFYHLEKLNLCSLIFAPNLIALSLSKNNLSHEILALTFHGTHLSCYRSISEFFHQTISIPLP